MKTFTIFSFKQIKTIENAFLKEFEKNEKNPDFVVVVGGDGTLLQAEKEYPGIPKLCIRKNAKRCEFHKEKDLEKIIHKIKEKNFKIKTIEKLMVRLNNKIMDFAMNDVYIHHIPQKAVRFSFRCVDKKQSLEIRELIGDGLIVSTAHGSKAYFFSITGFSFENGFGLSFNNIHKIKISPLLLSKEFEVWVKLIRENGHLICDNRVVARVKKGDEIKIEPTNKKAKIILVV